MKKFPKIHTNDLVTFHSYAQGLNTLGPATESTSITRLENSRTGESLKGFKEVIRQGGNATTNMTGVKYSVESSFGGAIATYRYPFPVGSVYKEALFGINPEMGYAPQHINVSDETLKRVENIALSRFYAAARKAQRQISGPTFLGELRETIGLLRKPLASLDKLFTKYLTHPSFVHQRRRYARRNVHTAESIRRDLIDTASNLWLEYSLGIRPLLNDTEDIAVSIARLVHEIRHTVVRGYAKDTFSDVTTSSFTRANYFAGTIRDQKYMTYECIFRGGIRASVFDAPLGPLSNLQRVLGFTPSEFVPTIWELIPYSFVVDYFVNVGDILSQVSMDDSVISWMSKTTRRSTSSYRRSSLESQIPSVLLSWDGNSSWGEIRTVITSVNRQGTRPMDNNLHVQFSLPGFGGQYANLLALLAKSRL